MHLVKSNPLITILLPVFDGGEYFQECVYSILSQTFEDFELLVINDGSSDSTGEFILSTYDRRIRYIENKTNQGLIRSLNKGLHFSKGEYIARIDADDLCHVRRLEKQVNFLQSSKADIVGSNAFILGSNETIYKPATFDEIKINLLVNSCVIHPSVMMKKESLAKHSLYYDKDAIYAEDYKLWIDAVLSGLIIENIRENLIFYRIHGNQISTIKRNQQEMSANFIRFSYANFFFADLILNKEKEYLMLLYPSDVVGETSKETRESIFRLAELLYSYNNKACFFDKELFESFLEIRVQTIKKLIESSYSV